MSDDGHSPAVKLMTSQMEQRHAVRSRWLNDAGDLLFAHEAAFSAAASLVTRFAGRKFENQSQSIQGRLALTAQFIQGVDICETSISEGLYVQAAALLKQELETVAAVDEFEKNRRKDGKTPNVNNGSMREFGPIYGDFNNIAHVSRHELAMKIVTVIDKDLIGPSLAPAYNPELAKFLYGNHVYFIIQIARAIGQIFIELFDERISEDEDQWLFLATMLLLQTGCIDLPDKEKERFPFVSEMLQKMRADPGLRSGTN